MENLGPLSHSSAGLLLDCEQRYSYYKLEKVPEDPDFKKSDALAVGSAFHYILEKSLHEKPASITADIAYCLESPEIGLDESDAPLVHAMVLKYLRLHKRMGLRVVAVETELKTNWFHGFIDAIMEDADCRWWIVDLKTYKSLHLPSVAALPRDPQLNLYAGHMALLAELHGLELKRFGGVRWRVTTKSTAKQKGGESVADYVARLTEQYIKSYDIPVKASSLNPDERMTTHYSLWERAKDLKNRPPVRNYRNCMNYFAPCPYWSRCHGKMFSEMQDIADQITLED